MKQRKSRWRKARKAGEDLPPNKYIAEQLVRRGNVCMYNHSVRLGPYSSLSTTFTASGMAWLTKNRKKYFTNKSVEFML